MSDGKERGFHRWRPGFFRSDGSQPDVRRLEEHRPEEGLYTFKKASLSEGGGTAKP